MYCKSRQLYITSHYIVLTAHAQWSQSTYTVKGRQHAWHAGIVKMAAVH